MKKSLVFSAVAVLAMISVATVSSPARADQQSSPTTKKKSQKAAPKSAAHDATSPDAIEPDIDGCGLGWQVTKKKTLSAATTRGTTNVFVPPSFGMTSGTLGCTQLPLSKREEEAVRYAYNNFDSLSVEMAEGHGEFLSAFAQVIGCDSGAVDSFSQLMQSHYRDIMSNGRINSFQLVNRVKNQIQSDEVLAIRCNAV